LLPSQEDPFVSTDELANEIVKVRSERFDRALNHVLKLVGDKAPDEKKEEGVMAKVSKATSAETSAARTKVASHTEAGEPGPQSRETGGVGTAKGLHLMRIVVWVSLSVACYRRVGSRRRVWWT
jgi:hypothetical protein